MFANGSAKRALKSAKNGEERLTNKLSHLSTGGRGNYVSQPRAQCERFIERAKCRANINLGARASAAPLRRREREEGREIKYLVVSDVLIIKRASRCSDVNFIARRLTGISVGDFLLLLYQRCNKEFFYELSIEEITRQKSHERETTVRCLIVIFIQLQHHLSLLACCRQIRLRL